MTAVAGAAGPVSRERSALMGSAVKTASRTARARYADPTAAVANAGAVVPGKVVRKANVSPAVCPIVKEGFAATMAAVEVVAHARRASA